LAVSSCWDTGSKGARKDLSLFTSPQPGINTYGKSTDLSSALTGIGWEGENSFKNNSFPAHPWERICEQDRMATSTVNQQIKLESLRLLGKKKRRKKEKKEPTLLIL
jgi:hypothetical protein